MFKENYEKYYSVDKLKKEFSSNLQKERINMMLEVCNPAESILDVGAGVGNLMKQALWSGHKNVEGIELASHLFRYLKDEGLNVKKGDARNLPYPNKSFDDVMLGEILEHLRNPGDALKEAFRVARKKVIFSLPITNLNDDWHYWNVKAGIIGTFLVVCFEKKDDSR